MQLCRQAKRTKKNVQLLATHLTLKTFVKQLAWHKCTNKERKFIAELLVQTPCWLVKAIILCLPYNKIHFFFRSLTSTFAGQSSVIMPQETS